MAKIYTLICFMVIIISGILIVSAKEENETNEADETHKETETNIEDGIHEGHDQIQFYHLNFDRVKNEVIFSLVILTAALLQIIFHHAEWLSELVPESCLLIIFGLIVGFIIHAEQDPNTFVTLTPDLFLLILLPPIVLDSAYSLNNCVFWSNFGSILLFAAVGTVINFVLIGGSLYLLSFWYGFPHDPTECFFFASFIVAVDPVAVLAIFQEVGVNAKLYFLVFGESLLNDAVTIVIYNVMKTFNTMDDIHFIQILYGIAAFFVTTFGSIAIGIVCGIITAIITRLTKHVELMEVLSVITLAYLSYLLAEVFHWSGIVSMIACGLVQAEFALKNISEKSNTTVKYFISMLSSMSDTVIFMFLGLELIRNDHEWNTYFSIAVLLLCLLSRAVSVFGLTAIVNFFYPLCKISFKEKFIMWYGGLRGAVCFALVATVDDDADHFKNTFMTTSFLIILFTVFIQGSTVKPLVNKFNIEKADDSDDLNQKLHGHVICHLMGGIEAVIGSTDENQKRAMIGHFIDKYIRKILQTCPHTHDQLIVTKLNKMAMRSHVRHISESTYNLAGVETEFEMSDLADQSIHLQNDSPKVPQKDYRSRTHSHIAAVAVRKISRAFSIFNSEEFINSDNDLQSTDEIVLLDRAIMQEDASKHNWQAKRRTALPINEAERFTHRFYEKHRRISNITKNRSASCFSYIEFEDDESNTIRRPSKHQIPKDDELVHIVKSAVAARKISVESMKNNENSYEPNLVQKKKTMRKISGLAKLDESEHENQPRNGILNEVFTSDDQLDSVKINFENHQDKDQISHF